MNLFLNMKSMKIWNMNVVRELFKKLLNFSQSDRTTPRPLVEKEKTKKNLSFNFLSDHKTWKK